VLLLSRREVAGCDALVETCLGGVDHGLLEPVDRLAVRLRELGERPAVLQLLPQLVDGEPQVIGGCRDWVAERRLRKRAGHAVLPIDDLVGERTQLAEHLLLLRRRDLPGGDALVELRLGGVD
jgi:hypothetical protein